MNRTTSKTVKQLFTFIEKSPSSYHAVDRMKKNLQIEGYTELAESRPWALSKGGQYYVTRNLSSIIAFKIPSGTFSGFHITASHSDSPSFRIKENAEITADSQYIKLNVEKYGGMLMPAWLDRPLSVAGRVVVKDGSSMTVRLVNVDRDLILIPNPAIHMNRQLNEGYKYNPQTDMLPLYGGIESKDSFMNTIASAAGVGPDAVIGSDLYLYNRMPGTIWGAGREYISAPRLDDLQCAFASLQGFLLSRPQFSIPVQCVLDNEEVGSGTKQGAASTFLKDTLRRICLGLNGVEEDYHREISHSFMLSADNAHAVHPNQAQKADLTNRPYMNQGVVIKYNGNQKYTTDGISAAIFKTICEEKHIPLQTYFNRSDMAGGSTLGNISSSQVPVNTIDVGLAQLAMHSPYETAGVKDTDYMIQAVKAFFEASIQCNSDGDYNIIV